MSGAGGIELIALPFALGFGAVYLVGKGLVAAGKGIYKLHTEAEKRRFEQAKAEYAAVSGELARIALLRHAELTDLEGKMAADYVRTAHERDSKIAAAHAALTSADRGLVEYTRELPRYFEERRKAIDAAADAEIRGFKDELEAKSRSLIRNVELETERVKAEKMAELAKVDAALTERTEKSRMYALQVKSQAEVLLEVIRRNYQCDVFAPTELAIAEESLKKLEEDLAKDDVNAAAMMAADLGGRLTILQVQAELRTAAFGHQKAVLEERAARLKDMVEKTHDITDGSPEGSLDDFVDEEYGADFWSDGRLSRLWKEAEELIREVEAFSYNDHGNPSVLAAALDKKGLELEQEHARVRSLLMGRVALNQLSQDAIDCMESDGWEFQGAVRHKNAAGEEDIRLPFDLIFTRDDDEWVITAYEELDPETGLYKQGMSRFPHEAGHADEQKREEVDKKLSEEMQKKGHEFFSMKCDPDTIGEKIN